MSKGKGTGAEKKPSMVIGAAVLTVLAAGAGGSFGFYLSGEVKPSAEATPAAAKEAQAKPSLPSDTKLVELAPMVTNLAEPKNTWIRVEASLITDGEVDAALGGKVAEDIVAFLKSMTLGELDGASGFQHLREDLNDRARVRGGSQVRELVIHGVIVE
ncbi:MAG TPA: flagellar basal body-associated FliL family protein [Hyphomicrobiaceae bacterium]|nr:flagellar basal body-associated FliL family protein [Hyphomicrobiaceae bacterium]